MSGVRKNKEISVQCQGYFIAGEKGEYEKVTGQEAREIERNKVPKPGARLQSLHFTQSCRTVLFRM